MGKNPPTLVCMQSVARRVSITAFCEAASYLGKAGRFRFNHSRLQEPIGYIPPAYAEKTLGGRSRNLCMRAPALQKLASTKPSMIHFLGL